MKYFVVKNFSICLQGGPIQIRDRKGEPSLRAKPFGPCWGHSDQKLERAIKMKQLKKKVTNLTFKPLETGMSRWQWLRNSPPPPSTISPRLTRRLVSTYVL